MYSNKTEENIKKNMLENISSNTDKAEKGFVDNAISPAAMEFANVYLELGSIADKIDVENLEDEELEMFINQRTGITRKKATKSTTTVIVGGQEGATIKIDDLVGADTVNFIAKEDKTIDATGQIEVLVECEQTGIIGNIPAGAIKFFPVSIAGLISVTNMNPITNGYNAESDESLLERYNERIRTPATSGNKYHYKNWAKAVTGVGDARVFSLWNGDNTVKVVIIDSNKQPASVDLIENVQNYIDPNISGLGEGQAPIGAFCTVTSATGKAIDVTFKVIKDENYSLEQIGTNVEKNKTEYLKSIAFKEDVVSYAKIGALILDSKGVLDYTDLKINLGTSNIVISNQEVAVLGEVIISE